MLNDDRLVEGSGALCSNNTYLSISQYRELEGMSSRM
jgi:hypothetical protein